jgi:hypothetical protein
MTDDPRQNSYMRTLEATGAVKPAEPIQSTSTLTRTQRRAIEQERVTYRERHNCRLALDVARKKYQAACKAYGFARCRFEKVFEKGEG